MAFIPDEAYDDKKEVGEKAFLLFAFYCKHGSMTNNKVTVSLERAADFLGVVYENACRLNAKLKKKGWIIQKNGETTLLKGYGISDIPAENNSPKLTKTTVSDDKTDENNSFDDLKTDENVSFPNFDNSKTDENNSPKLTNSSVAYKEEPTPLNQQEEKDKPNGLSKKKKPPPFEIFPVPRSDAKPELWNAFLEHRAQIKKPLTEKAYKLIINDLSKLGIGFDINRRLIETVDRKWQGLIFKDDFETNGAKNGTSNQKKPNADNGHQTVSDLRRRIKAAEDLRTGV